MSLFEGALNVEKELEALELEKQIKETEKTAAADNNHSSPSDTNIRTETEQVRNFSQITLCNCD